MSFLLAFACTVASVDATGAFVCADRNRVTLAGIQAREDSDAPADLVGKKMRCQAFDSAGPQQLTATCRYVSGADVGCDFVTRGLAKSVARDRRHYELAKCRRCPAPSPQGQVS